MKKIIRLNTDKQQVKIVSDSGFTRLQLLSGKIIEGKPLKDLIGIEMKISNDERLLTCASWLKQDTGAFEPYNLLDTASGIAYFKNVVFHTLRCAMPKHVFEGPAEIELQFEIASQAEIKVIYS